MPLLAPLFLLAIAAVGIPLLVHLVHREKREPTAFPSLMFLEKVPAPFSSRRNLRDPWLFALRALAVIALALAFARPVLGRRTAVGGSDVRRRDVVVLLDRSFSMRIGGRWGRARAAVDSVIRTLAKGDRMTLIAFDRRAAAVTPMTSDASELRAGLESLQPTDESTRLAPAMAMAQQRLATSEAPRKVLVFVSDFQRSAWDLTDDARMPPGTEIAPIDVSGGAPVADRSVRSVTTRREKRAGPERMLVSARVANTGPAVRGVALRLEIGGRVIDERTVDLPADGGADVTFAPVPVPPDPVPARVTLAPDSLRGDDAFHFLLQQDATLPVLIIDGRASPFLASALAIGDAPHFDVVTRSPTRVTAADLAGRRLVILADGAFPSGLGAARLLRFVTDGGGLITALGEAAIARNWPEAARSLLPGTIRSVTERGAADPAVIGAVDQRHPALALLAGPRGGDLSAARFRRYRAIDTSEEVLARFDDGSAALSEHAVGTGRVLTFGSSFDGVWNDLPRQPVFLPLVQQLARYAATWRESNGAFEIGANVRPSDLAVGNVPQTSRWVSVAPSGARTTFGGDGAAASLTLTEAGVHALRPGGTPGARPLLVAANIAPAELDFTTFDPLRLTTAITATPGAATPGAQPAEAESAADREARQSTWWYLLVAAVLLLIAESLVARRAAARTLVVE